jgi:uncharacterized protein (TIGR02001 family)
MRKTIIAASLALAAFAAPQLASAQAAAPAAAPPSDHTFTGNMALVTDYRFRGISQTFKQPAIQGGFDYSHGPTGIYLGNWNSNVSEGAGFPSGNIEMDFYGGWKKTWGDWGLDLGAIYYYYPGSDASATNGTTFTNPRDGSIHNGKVSNTELYIGGSWKWISLKYYRAISDYFSLPNTDGSDYWDLSANYDLGGGWNLLGHVGVFSLKNWDNGIDVNKGSYTDWKIGVTKDLNGWILGAAYIDTNAKGSCNAANPGFYCFGNSLPGASASKFKDASKGTVVLSVSKTF